MGVDVSLSRPLVSEAAPEIELVSWSFTSLFSTNTAISEKSMRLMYSRSVYSSTKGLSDMKLAVSVH